MSYNHRSWCAKFKSFFVFLLSGKPYLKKFGKDKVYSARFKTLKLKCKLRRLKHLCNYYISFFSNFSLTRFCKPFYAGFQIKLTNLLSIPNVPNYFSSYFFPKLAFQLRLVRDQLIIET